MTKWPEPLARAYAACEALARSHYENFPVASRLLPRPMRPHVAAVYAYARTADDMADEGDAPAADRLARLDAWQRRLHAAVEAPGTLVADDVPIITAVAHSIRTLGLPLSLFDDLVSAFGQDTTTTRYDSWSAVLDYCRRSANPVGRLVLRIAAQYSDAAAQSSDAFCTALQLTNFWQDFGRDWRAGRLYIPREAYEARGASERDLQDGVLSDRWVAVLADCVAVTQKLFECGRAVCDRVAGRLRYELRFTWLGGRRVLDRVYAQRHRLMTDRPTLGAADAPALLWRAITWTTDDGRRTTT